MPPNKPAEKAQNRGSILNYFQKGTPSTRTAAHASAAPKHERSAVSHHTSPHPPLIAEVGAEDHSRSSCVDSKRTADGPANAPHSPQRQSHTQAPPSTPHRRVIDITGESSPALPIRSSRPVSSSKSSQKPALKASPSAQSNRPCTPNQNSAEFSFSSPTRTLFPPSSNNKSFSKRSVDYLSSPEKAHPPAKSVKLSPEVSPRSLEGTPSLPNHLSSPSLKSSPPSLEKSKNSEPVEVKDSEDESDMSDDCFPDLDDLPLSRPAAALRNGSGSVIPPRGKGSQISMLKPSAAATAKKPQAKFDMKMLLDEQARGNELKERVKRMDDAELLASHAARQASPGKGKLGINFATSPSSVRHKFVEVAGVKKETAGRTLRALERTETANSHRSQWYFFKKSSEATPKQPPAFPGQAAQGPWALLSKASTRTRCFESGTLSLLARRVQVPDSLYTWVLRSLCVEEDYDVRQRYAEFASDCCQQVSRIMTPDFLREMLQLLDAADDIDEYNLEAVQDCQDQYETRDWSALASYLDCLASSAGYLGLEAITYGTTSLLRMAADKVICHHPRILAAHQTTLQNMLEAVPTESWDDFCQEVASNLSSAFDQQALRVKPLLCMAQASYRLRDLRRRLALALFLDDPSHAAHHADHENIVKDISMRMWSEGLEITPDTNYVELKAHMQLLDMAVDDGSYHANPSDRDAEDNFNQTLDNLTRSLSHIWGRINDAGALYLTRTEAKSTIDCARKRLIHTARTRRVPREDILDMPGDIAEEKRKKREQSDEKQRNWMQEYLKSKTKRPGGTDTKKTPRTPNGDNSSSGPSDMDAYDTASEGLPS